MKLFSVLCIPATVSFTILAVGVSALGQELRPLSTDRPDTTESPFTMDAGRFQLEMEIASWSRDGGGEESSFGELNAKFGLDAANDLQFVLPFFTHLAGGDEGFGDMQVRLKHNIWGNGGGDTALGIMPFLQIPTGHGEVGSGKFEGGIILPFAFSGPGDWSFGIQAQADLLTGDDDNYDFGFLASATASHPLTENSGAFAEWVSILSSDSGSAWESYFHTGMTWAPSPTWQVDGGIRVGLTKPAVDFTPFVGLSTKF